MSYAVARNERDPNPIRPSARGALFCAVHHREIHVYRIVTFGNLFLHSERVGNCDVGNGERHSAQDAGFLNGVPELRCSCGNGNIPDSVGWILDFFLS